MLKALELVGFKSFADRTRFEFPAGITVVVGPNGSGKSNIVDAVKWVLGEQSVKSLRGQEMADVIFNGSGTRRPMNSAEVTLVFDNASRRLPFDAPEVSITRRVYRGGEGEYLINRAPARLRDIRDLILGTGLGAQAYCVIEQGKVDALLQASPRDRRSLFEEAAGISRFRGKKTEALRRLDRVGQNLLRLHDIVEEVDNRLKGLRAQAGKARRYREYAARLQELRTQVAQLDYRRLTAQISVRCEAVAELQRQQAEWNAALGAAEARISETDAAIAASEEEMHLREAEAADCRARIAALETAVEHDRSLLDQLEQETARAHKQLLAVSLRAGDLKQQLSETVESLQRAEEEHQRISLHMGEAERRLTEAIAAADRLKNELVQHREAAGRQAKKVGELESRLAALRAQRQSAEAACRAAADRRAQCAAQTEAIEEEHRRIEGETARVAAEDAAAQAELAAAQAARDDLQTRYAALQTNWTEQQRRAAAVRERIGLLEELERRQEGVGAGVKWVLSAARRPDAAPWSAVAGMLADLLRVSVEMAPVIEAALGPVAQYLVVAGGGELRDLLRRQLPALGGRVGLIWLDSGGSALSAETAGTDPSAARVEEHPAVLGRADQFVEIDPPFEPLLPRLLGRTYLVRTPADAIDLSAQAPGLTFIAADGAMTAADGVVLLGPMAGSTGLISRKSELRSLAAERVRLDQAIAATRSEIERLEAESLSARRAVDEATDRRRAVAAALAEIRAQLAAAELRRREHAERIALFDRQLRLAEDDAAKASAELAHCEEELAAARDALSTFEQSYSAVQRQSDRAEEHRRLCDQAAAEIRIELAKSDERLRNLLARLAQFEEHDRERQRALSDSREQLAQTARRAEAARWNILHAESQLAELYLHREAAAAEAGRCERRRDELRRQRAAEAAEAQRLRAKNRKLDEKIHAEQMAEGELRTQRTALVERLREEYGIELKEDAAEASEPLARDAAQEEIDDLRRKINSLGNVNLESLDELDELESRYRALSEQYDDLVKAKAALEKIIQRINVDSRRLLSETLETVRGHFQSLFRDLFGGGQADIVLEEGVDILDSGIEIVARPPGKEPRAISLLSGGEKTLTCVALLLAIFRSRPSPFCVLDEVDAALDEANIDRFTKVLKDFLAWTQFIIVTHSKKTMTAADTLYGVTMQESGVSRQVSVRFEDVRENGEIIVRDEPRERPTNGNRRDNGPSVESRAA